MLPLSRRGNTALTSTHHSSKGNIVLTLSEQNAARLLLNAVQALPKPGDGSADHRMEEKDKEFYAAIFDSKPEVSFGSESLVWMLAYARFLS